MQSGPRALMDVYGNVVWVYPTYDIDANNTVTLLDVNGIPFMLSKQSMGGALVYLSRSETDLLQES